MNTAFWLYIFFAIYLLPAVVGYIFYAKTKDKKLINYESYKACKERRGEKWYEANIDFQPFWAESVGPSIFLLPGSNIIFLIGTFLTYRKYSKATDQYIYKQQTKG